MPIHLSENARKVLEVRYLQRDVSGQIIETRRIRRGTRTLRSVRSICL
jgi:hypothetical protein